MSLDLLDPDLTSMHAELEPAAVCMKALRTWPDLVSLAGRRRRRRDDVSAPLSMQDDACRRQIDVSFGISEVRINGCTVCISARDRSNQVPRHMYLERMHVTNGIMR